MKTYLKYYDCGICKRKTPHTLHFNYCTPFNEGGSKIVYFFISCNECKTLKSNHASLRIWCEWTGDTVQEVFDKIKPIPNSNEAY